MEWPNLTLNFRSKGQLQDCQLLAFQKINSKQTNRQIERQTDRQKNSNSKFQKTILLLIMLVRLRINIEGPGQKQFPGEKLRY